MIGPGAVPGLPSSSSSAEFSCTVYLCQVGRPVGMSGQIWIAHLGGEFIQVLRPLFVFVLRRFLPGIGLAIDGGIVLRTELDPAPLGSQQLAVRVGR